MYTKSVNKGQLPPKKEQNGITTKVWEFLKIYLEKWNTMELKNVKGFRKTEIQYQYKEKISHI